MGSMWQSWSVSPVRLPCSRKNHLRSVELWSLWSPATRRRPRILWLPWPQWPIVTVSPLVPCALCRGDRRALFARTCLWPPFLPHCLEGFLLGGKITFRICLTVVVRTHRSMNKKRASLWCADLVPSFRCKHTLTYHVYTYMSEPIQSWNSGDWAPKSIKQCLAQPLKGFPASSKGFYWSRLHQKTSTAA